MFTKKYFDYCKTKVFGPLREGKKTMKRILDQYSLPLQCDKAKKRKKGPARDLETLTFAAKTVLRSTILRPTVKIFKSLRSAAKLLARFTANG